MKQKKLKKLLKQHRTNPVFHVTAEIDVHATSAEQAKDLVSALISDDASLTPWLAFAAVQDVPTWYDEDEVSESESEHQIDYAALPPWEDGPLVKAMNEAAARGETLLVDEVEDYRGAQDRFRQFYITKARDLLMVPDEGPQVRFRVTRDDDFKARADGIPVGEYCWSLTCDEAPFECWDARSCGEATDLIPAFWAYLSEGTFVFNDRAGEFTWIAPEASGYELYVRGTQETPDHG